MLPSMAKKMRFLAFPVLLILCSLSHAEEETEQSLPAALQALSPALAEEELTLQRRQAAQRVAQLERAREGGACSLLEMMTAQRRSLQTELALLRKSHPQASLSAQEAPLAEKIGDFYAKEVALSTAMAEQGLLPMSEALERKIEATRYRRDLALLQEEKRRGLALQEELCSLFKERLCLLEELAQQAGIADGAALLQAEGQWKAEEARLRDMSPPR